MRRDVFCINTRQFGIIKVVAESYKEARRIARRYGVYEAASVWRQPKDKLRNLKQEEIK
jgi:hypothetical protein